MPLLRKRAVEMSRIITSTAFARKEAAATETSGELAGAHQPQATTSAAAASQSFRQRRAIISSNEESAEEVIAPPASPTQSLPIAEEEIGNLPPPALS
ncbi:hypothetical protein SNE40_012568 [Patella caerulea]|uniref:Uncharacterized protein n=1 Tax=Patella caerulea TaxID=87958 RepID=A0AAN8PNH1_PATCE